MESKKFKKIFFDYLKELDFTKKKTEWLKEYPDSIVSLELQKSAYSNLYYLNIKSCIQNLFGQRFSLHDDSVKNYYGEPFFRPPEEYNLIFNLESNLTDEEREDKLKIFFSLYLESIILKISTARGVLDFIESSELCIVPKVKMALEQLVKPQTKE